MADGRLVRTPEKHLRPRYVRMHALRCLRARGTGEGGMQLALQGPLDERCLRPPIHAQMQMHARPITVDALRSLPVSACNLVQQMSEFKGGPCPAVLYCMVGWLAEGACLV